MIYRSVELYHTAMQGCNKRLLEAIREYSEMTPFQHDFLCGMIKEKRPKKILEIGVSAGGSTVIVLDCLQTLGLRSEMYSVDLLKSWYRSEKRETGFVAKEYLKQNRNELYHEFILGESIPYVIDRIGDDIDFLILDTTHSLPGELLDFLICLPYLKDGCIVVLHDVIENHLTCRNNEIATKLLFDLVCGNKWYMCEDELDVFGFSNIAAFEVNQQTRENINTVFAGLSMSWEYMLTEEESKKYFDIIKNGYSKEYYKWFKKIFDLQKYTQIRKEISWHYGMNHEWLKMKWKKQKNVFLYGGGYWAKTYSEYARINRLPISGWVISDEQELVETGRYSLPVYHLKDLPCKPEECSIILALDKRHYGIIKKNLIDKGYYMVL